MGSGKVGELGPESKDVATLRGNLRCLCRLVFEERGFNATT